jgi:hypothetical protein
MDGLSSKWTLLGRDWGAESVPCLCVCEREIEEEGGVHGGERREQRERERELVSCIGIKCSCMLLHYHTYLTAATCSGVGEGEMGGIKLHVRDHGSCFHLLMSYILVFVPAP